jgi:hypothetical protein
VREKHNRKDGTPSRRRASGYKQDSTLGNFQSTGEEPFQMNEEDIERKRKVMYSGKVSLFTPEKDAIRDKETL